MADFLIPPPLHLRKLDPLPYCFLEFGGGVTILILITTRPILVRSCETRVRDYRIKELDIIYFLKIILFYFILLYSNLFYFILFYGKRSLPPPIGLAERGSGK